MNNENLEIPNLNNKENKEGKKNNKTYKEFIIDFKNYITTRQRNELLELFFRMLIVAGIVLLLYVPFILFKEIGPNIFVFLGINYTTAAINRYNIFMNTVYSIAGIAVYFILLKVQRKFVK